MLCGRTGYKNSGTKCCWQTPFAFGKLLGLYAYAAVFYFLSEPGLELADAKSITKYNTPSGRTIHKDAETLKLHIRKPADFRLLPVSLRREGLAIPEKHPAVHGHLWQQMHNETALRRRTGDMASVWLVQQATLFEITQAPCMFPLHSIRLLFTILRARFHGFCLDFLD
jgi:hypothetical protein